ncbi:MAG: hypothetical protein LUD46_19365 [Parabacteroides sp.]|nr:hypothetical protein [Parabacteroides sp.]
MNPKEKERIAVCCVLLDMIKSLEGSAALSGCPHYQQLKNKLLLTDADIETAREESVLLSLAALKNAHYNTKMLLAMTISDLYSSSITISLSHRIAFEVLMNAIDWPISLTEVLARSKKE